ncbi:hypothetical protein ACRAWD_12185 [Caulobacter segnis]
MTRKSDGLPVGAVQGFCNMLPWKLMRDACAGRHLRPRTWPSSGTTPREDVPRLNLYDQYKAHLPSAAARGTTSPAVSAGARGHARVRRAGHRGCPATRPTT